MLGGLSQIASDALALNMPRPSLPAASLAVSGMSTFESRFHPPVSNGWTGLKRPCAAWIARPPCASLRASYITPLGWSTLGSLMSSDPFSIFALIWWDLGLMSSDQFSDPLVTPLVEGIAR